ncbi:MAG: endonuclease, partial [Flavobacterium sp.]|nr:endonuclease [Flavobacterium sp.]
MKKIYSLITILFVTLGFAQNSTKNTLEVNSIPAGYYDTAIGTGYTLKTQLFNIIDNNTNSGSNASYGDLWTLYTQTAMRDNYYENDGSLLDLYSENPTG